MNTKEIECCSYLLNGMTLKNIAQITNLSSRTIESHINQKKFFNVCTKKEALLKAYGTGFRNKNYNKIDLIINKIHIPQLLLHTKCVFNTYYLSICLLGV